MVKRSDYQEAEVQACFSVLLQKLSWWSSLLGGGDKRPLIKNKLAKEGLAKIKAKFATVETIGPVWVADFLEIFPLTIAVLFCIILAGFMRNCILINERG